jgi:hypothetical protein
MSEFIIEERIRFAVHGETAQEALDNWLNAGEDAPGYSFREVSDRHVEDEQGNVQDTEEDGPY